LSDRRWRQFVALARTAAASEGRDSVDAYDLWLAPYVASAKPESLPALQHWFEHELLAMPPSDAPWLERALQAFEKQLQIEQSAPAEDNDDGAGKLALARAIGLGERDEDAQPGAQRIVSARLEASLRRRYSPVHIACRALQVREIETQVATEHAQVQQRAEAMARALADRIWMPPTLRTRLAQQHARALQLLDGFAQRLAASREGFAALPCDDSATASAPAPVALSELVE
jgi:MoxR-like ATPase